MGGASRFHRRSGGRRLVICLCVHMVSCAHGAGVVVLGVGVQAFLESLMAALRHVIMCVVQCVLHCDAK